MTTDHVLILGQSEIKNSYLMRIDDFLPLVDDYALFPLGCMPSRSGSSQVSSFFILLESGFVFFLIICYLGFYNSYPRLAQI